MDTVDSPAAALLPPDHQQLWERVNDTTADIPPATLGESFLRLARKRPDLLAVAAARRRLSYGELAARAGAAAERIRASRSRTVLVCVEPGWEQVVAVVAAALAGKPFHAVDPAASQPARWQRLDALDADIVLTQSWLDERLRWPEATGVVALDGDPPPAASPPPQPAAAPVAEIWCWVSLPAAGGEPVPVTHDAVINTVTDLARRFDVGATDRALLVTPLGDPACLTAIAGMLLAGGAVVVPDDIDLHTPAVWFDLIRREQVTVWHATPTLTGLLAEHLNGRGEPAPEPLRLALLGGEPLPPRLVDRLRRAAGRALRVVNLGPGGPAGLWATCLEVTDPPPGEGQVPVGYPLANKRAYVLSEALTPCPVWVTGRLHVGGRGLVTGSAGLVRYPATGEWLYRTDLTGRLLPDGTIDVVGDDATRISAHGHPLNLRDVEGRLAAHPAVLRAAVVPHGDGSVGYAKVEPGAGVTGTDLLDQLRKQMSPYLLPSRIELVGAFAVTADGRLDRAALTGPAEPAADAAPASADRTAGPAAPADLVERACQLAAEVLGVASVEQHLNLLDLGATSVLLVRLATKVEEELGIIVDIDELLQFPSVAVMVSSAAAAPPPAAAANRPAPALILDPVDRQVFKDRQPGLRRDLMSAPAMALADSGTDLARLGRRRTYRTFAPEPVPVADLAALLAALRQLQPAGAAEPKYAYPSAGGLYPVQAYLTVADGRVDGLAAGAYYYQPAEHRLLTLAPAAAVPATAHAWINRDAFRASAFALYLVADRDAIDAMYGDQARDYCLIEAGAICQLLMSVAVETGLGLCPVGTMDATLVADQLRLRGQHDLLHVLLGGGRPAGDGTVRQPGQGPGQGSAAPHQHPAVEIR